MAAYLFAAMFSFTAFAQTVTITGNVKNSNSKETVPAVSVAIKGTSVGTYTDDNGNFSISTSAKLVCANHRLRSALHNSAVSLCFNIQFKYFNSKSKPSGKLLMRRTISLERNGSTCANFGPGIALGGAPAASCHTRRLGAHCAKRGLVELASRNEEYSDLSWP